MTLESVAFAECRSAVASCVVKNIKVPAVAFIVTDYVIAELIIGNIVNERRTQTHRYGCLWKLNPNLNQELVFNLSLTYNSGSIDECEETFTIVTETITQCELIAIFIQNKLLDTIRKILNKYIGAPMYCSDIVPISIHSLLTWTMKRIVLTLDNR